MNTLIIGEQLKKSVQNYCVNWITVADRKYIILCEITEIRRCVKVVKVLR
jgi:chlorite dismutase